MARLDLAYARSLLRVAEPGDLARVVWRRVGDTLSRGAAPPRVDDEAVRAAADALGRAPRLFGAGSLGAESLGVEPLGERHRALFAEAPARVRTRAAAILAHEIDVFGVARALGPVIDWRRDPLSGKRCDGDGLFPDGVDPKGCWEVARAGHLVELGAAARLLPSLAGSARDEVAAQIGAFLDANVCGRGIHYASPLEVAMRAVHWLAAVELCGGATVFARAFVEKLAAALLCDAHFLRTHLEDRGIVPANHLLGDWVGLWVIGLALDGAPGARAWQADAARALAVEAARQVGRDGAHFEASTAYHRFALELMLVAHLWARAADRTSPVAETLHAMFIYLRNYIGPDGCPWCRAPPATTPTCCPSAPRSSAIRRCATRPCRSRRRRCGCAGRAPLPTGRGCRRRRRRARPRSRRADCTSCAARAGRSSCAPAPTGKRASVATRTTISSRWSPGSTARRSSSTPAPGATPPTW